MIGPDGDPLADAADPDQCENGICAIPAATDASVIAPAVTLVDLTRILPRTG